MKTSKHTLKIVFLVLMIMAGPKLMSKLAWIQTKSIDKSLCIIDRHESDSEINKGDVIFFREPKIAGCSLVAKYSSCLPGELIKITDNEVFCNDKQISTGFIKGKERLKSGEVFQLKEDEYFVSGTHPKSWDSRYSGPIKKLQIEKLGLLCL